MTNKQLPQRSQLSVKRTQQDNVYDPVFYMLEKQKWIGGGTFSDFVDGKINEEKEGGELIRDDKYLLKVVEGDEYKNHYLYYNDKSILQHYVCIHKQTGRTEQWDLIWGEWGFLKRYNYTLVSEGMDESEVPVEDDENYWMTGEYVDDLV